MRRSTWLPAASTSAMPVSAQRWYSGLSGEITATLRGWPCRSPPAHRASRPNSFLLAYSVAALDTSVQLGGRLQP